MYLPQCSKCQTIISANELVMRADDKYIYHIDCFTCCLCNVVLKPGDDYGLHGSLLFCRLHLEQTTNTTFSLCSPIKSSTNNNLNIKKSRQNGTTTQRKQRTKLNNLENNTNNLEITSFLNGNDLSNSDGSYSSTIFPNPSSSNPQQRTKRNRTSFKHHQLRIMKTFFAQNHNPDSKGLKILSQKTQLSKRVLQVIILIFFSFFS
jgi:LIM homeobox protein 2/9